MDVNHLRKSCHSCGKSSANGWLIIDHRCFECGPEKFEARRTELREQGERIFGGDQIV